MARATLSGGEFCLTNARPVLEENVLKITSALPLYLINAHSFACGYFLFCCFVYSLRNGCITPSWPAKCSIRFDKPPRSVGNKQLCAQCDALALKKILQKNLHVDHTKQKSGWSVEVLYYSDNSIVSFELSWFGRAASLSRFLFKHVIFYKFCRAIYYLI